MNQSNLVGRGVIGRISDDDMSQNALADIQGGDTNVESIEQVTNYFI